MNTEHRNMKKTKARHIIIKLLKINEKRNIKNSQKKTKTYYKQRNKISMIADFLWETMQVGRQWSHIFKELMKKMSVNLEFYTHKNIFKNKGEIKNSLDKQKLKEFSSSRLALHKNVKIFKDKEYYIRWISQSTKRNKEHQK